ncbi:MAG: hypothetical protein ABI854_11010, partial [Betaproteobacteria bacterium]
MAPTSFGAFDAFASLATRTGFLYSGVVRFGNARLLLPVAMSALLTLAACGKGAAPPAAAP